MSAAAAAAVTWIAAAVACAAVFVNGYLGGAEMIELAGSAGAAPAAGGAVRCYDDAVAPAAACAARSAATKQWWGIEGAQTSLATDACYLPAAAAVVAAAPGPHAPAPADAAGSDADAAALVIAGQGLCLSDYDPDPRPACPCNEPVVSPTEPKGASLFPPSCRPDAPNLLCPSSAAWAWWLPCAAGRQGGDEGSGHWGWRCPRLPLLPGRAPRHCLQCTTEQNIGMERDTGRQAV